MKVLYVCLVGLMLFAIFMPGRPHDAAALLIGGPTQAGTLVWIKSNGEMEFQELPAIGTAEQEATVKRLDKLPKNRRKAIVGGPCPSPKLKVY